jgi:hypothetical protein
MCARKVETHDFLRVQPSRFSREITLRGRNFFQERHAVVSSLVP